MIAIGSKEKIKPFLEQEFPEFSGKGQGVWTSHDVPSRIRLIGEKVRAAGGALMGAYGGVYAISSEIIHGSVRSEEHTSELQSLMRISYAVFCLKKKKQQSILSE